MALQKYTKEWLEQLCADSYSFAEVLRKAGRAQAGGSQATLKKKIQEWVNSLNLKQNNNYMSDRR